MAVLKCKMCGGDLDFVQDASVATCEFCGSVQTIPRVDDEKKLTLFARANRLRSACEFDKAAGVYESIVADFPEEAEAYWGLVLCKYGIEYVDDPATGKKIPTCHRSSFDSVMEDSDFDQALENADGDARRVYREEAKQIEEIRKGIIAVSSNEKPYDIFICYKETDPKGDRTLDSVLAQDIYDALTDKGYRVFFSRITLEDKLGQEYEPYIFAALNSAKIMLAVGTDYEYYNAVWVKNEWSRFLKLMAKDKDKYLIPCFKGIDAYDMPKEFAKLQAQDLGKVGAIQDLLRGIDKILPKQVKQEQPVLQNQPDSQTLVFLERAKMAMEDGEWEKADDFCEKAMNINAHCADAYIGKLLIQYRVCSLEKLAEKRLLDTKDATSNDEQLKKEFLAQLVDTCVEKYGVPGYFGRYHIERLVQSVELSNINMGLREKQLQDEKTWWDEERMLKRALQFANPEQTESINQARQMVLAEMERRVARLQEDQSEIIESMMGQLHGTMQGHYETAAKQREADYESVVNMPQNADVHTIENASRLLRNMCGYKNSAEMLLELEQIRQKQKKAKALREKLTHEKAVVLGQLDAMGVMGNPFRKKELKKRLEEIDTQLDQIGK